MVIAQPVKAESEFLLDKPAVPAKDRAVRGSPCRIFTIVVGDVVVDCQAFLDYQGANVSRNRQIFARAEDFLE